MANYCDAKCDKVKRGRGTLPHAHFLLFDLDFFPTNLKLNSSGGGLFNDGALCGIIDRLTSLRAIRVGRPAEGGIDYFEN